ncbi:GNAT family N-acetyltransferase [Jeotgalibacillus proteolyticus]|uniref:N-acetyltransferase n=1 Tax=Jeotgalibacillus proteolyticus TaxID=2082395 RepID=A0A2S5GD32_9BACL|nr:GNAT family N-acetyltransferase [Jeotgalibacillus proteolyticus]PPA70947.1 N-acetyltransferase [Jeotgalibacillus proteolyticus]
MLSKIELEKINDLKQTAEAFDGVQLKLNEDWLEMDNPGGVKVFRTLDKEMLVGFLGVYAFGSTAEVCGMVHPDFRRKGIFSGLFKEAAIYMREQPYKEILLNSPTGSASGKGFLSGIPCTYKFSEYQMKWHPQELNPSSQASVRKALPEESGLRIRLDVEAFNVPREDAEEHEKRHSTEKNQTSYSIEHEGTAVGKIRIIKSETEAWIYGFATLPEYQGKGIGRSALQQILQKEADKGRDIHLEVQADNLHTLELYKSCGFKNYHSQDYYEYQG